MLVFGPRIMPFTTDVSAGRRRGEFFRADMQGGRRDNSDGV